MNQPFSYFSKPSPPSNKDLPNKPPSNVNNYNGNKGTPLTKQDTPTNTKSINFNPPSDSLSKEDNNYGFPPEIPKNPDISNKNFQQSKDTRYSPPQRNQPPEVPESSPKQKKINKNPTSRYYNPSPQQNQQINGDGYVTSPPLQDIINQRQKLPCFCVPYYLCKNGFINSGGRSVAALRRQKRTGKYYDFRNEVSKNACIFY